jgi:transcriptional regulator with XRE-family HTH domain
MPRKRRTTPLWKRVGAFVKARREELGLSQGEIIKALGYASRNAVSNIEVGIEGLPAKRIYAWADILEVPRDAFFRFATGEAARTRSRRSSGSCWSRIARSRRSTSAGFGSMRPSTGRWLARAGRSAREFNGSGSRTFRPCRGPLNNNGGLRASKTLGGRPLFRRSGRSDVEQLASER